MGHEAPQKVRQLLRIVDLDAASAAVGFAASQRVQRRGTVKARMSFAGRIRGGGKSDRACG